ncbi:MAG: acyltransferase family protein [Fusobacterium sp.]|uniref:acyltransferase family protein n=1 Tax=Fusobacterium sp. TaxID=68766 RepID=UPI0026DB14DF|nr:acyltransferase family protein [Fusobacterium sp.]MDO4691150.1 acyltransferase family protein [Fusobacterium sp.]
MERLEKRNIGIDVLKALSVISVIIYHLYEYKGTYIGVIVFFVISGYFISAILNERKESYLQFIFKRFSKIYPLLTIVLAVICSGYFLFNGYLTKKMIYSSLSAFLGLSNIYQIQSGMSYFERSGDMYPLLHTWTLSIEIQFYILYPFLIYSLKKLKVNYKKSTIILLILSLVSAVIMFLKAEQNYDINTLYYGSDTRVFSLLIGGAYYFAFKDKKINEKKMKIFSSISLVLIVAAILYVDYLMEINYRGLLYFLSILSGIIVVTTVKSNFLSCDNKIFKIIAGLGKHSYCYYLWQYPIMVFSEEYFKWSDIKYIYTVGIQVTILIIVSEISYIFLEERVKMAKLLQKTFFIVYLMLIFFLPISEETTSKIIEERINEVEIEMQLKNLNSEIQKTEISDDFEKRLTENDLEKDEVKTIEINEIEKVKENEENMDLEKASTDVGEVQETKDPKTDKKLVDEELTEKKEDADVADFHDEEEYTFIGDSVMKGAEPFIKEIFVNSFIDAKVSRQFTNLPQILEELKNKNSLSDRVVIHLGTNGVMNKESFEKSMEILKDKKVYLMNSVVPKFWEETINKNLNEWSKDYDNIVIIDWYKKAKGKKEMFYKDATHPNKEGAKIYAEFIYESIKN